MPQNLTVLDSGLIFHPIEWVWKEELKQANTLKRRFRRFVGETYRTLRTRTWCFTQISEVPLRQKNIYKSIGYHAFNLFAFGLMKPQFANHTFWSSDTFSALMHHLDTDEFRTGLEGNTYGYPYNPPGFEVPFALGCFKAGNDPRLVQTCQEWVDKQFKHGFNPQTGLHDQNTEDPATASARIYELAKVADHILDKLEPPSGM